VFSVADDVVVELVASETMMGEQKL